MLRAVCVLAGFIILAALMLLATQRAAPRIEADIAARAAIALSNAGVDGARVVANGRDLLVTGVARDSASREVASAALASLPGVRAVATRLDTIAMDPAADNLTLLVITRDGGELTLAGTVPDRAVADELAAGARYRFPTDRLVDELAPGSDPSARSRVTVALGGLDALGFLERGRLAVGDETAHLDGLAASPAGRERAVAALRAAVPAGFTVEQTVDIPASPRSAATCQTALDELLTDGIEFTPNESGIAAASLDLLDQVARVLLACPGLDIRVEAHTDTGGDENDNRLLTQRRADEVKRRLVEAGVPASRMAATGRGSSQPRADNATRAGRNANRRIEILVTGQPT